MAPYSYYHHLGLSIAIITTFAITLPARGYEGVHVRLPPGYPKKYHKQGQTTYQGGYSSSSSAAAHYPGYPPAWRDHQGRRRHPSGQSGYPSEQSGYATEESGYAGGQSGYPGRQSGYPSGQNGYPTAQSGYPTGESGYNARPSGYPSEEMTLPPGRQSASNEYPNRHQYQVKGVPGTHFNEIGYPVPPEPGPVPQHPVVGYPNYGYPVIPSSPNDVIVNRTFETPWDAAVWDQPLDPSVCRNLGGLTRPQKHLCSRNTDIAGAAAIGLNLAVRECRRQFANQRWNCTALTTPTNNPHTAAIMTRGFSESAFGHAITAAGVTHSVARACAAGRLYNCSCGMVRGKRAWKWSGCHDNTRFGARYSRRFLDVRERDKDVISFTHLYNNEVGRKVVRRNREVRCKCHGMSGSCEVRTCWKAAPDFRRVGDMLKEKYERARSATQEIFGNSANTARKYRPVRKEINPDSPLLYVERSPTFCEQDGVLSVAGTAGRLCNRTSTGPDSCDTLCCGRGYDQRLEVINRKCHCRFKWCCKVTCQDCSEEKWISVCK